MDKDFDLPQKKEKLYNWLKDKLKLYKKGNYKYAKFKEIIKENALSLASVSSTQFFNLTKELFQGNMKEIIMELKEDKNIQLNYIELLVKYINNEELSLMKKNLIMLFQKEEKLSEEDYKKDFIFNK